MIMLNKSKSWDEKSGCLGWIDTIPIGGKCGTKGKRQKRKPWNGHSMNWNNSSIESLMFPFPRRFCCPGSCVRFWTSQAGGRQLTCPHKRGYPARVSINRSVYRSIIGRNHLSLHTIQPPCQTVGVNNREGTLAQDEAKLCWKVQSSHDHWMMIWCTDCKNLLPHPPEEEGFHLGALVCCSANVAIVANVENAIQQWCNTHNKTQNMWGAVRVECSLGRQYKPRRKAKGRTPQWGVECFLWPPSGRVPSALKEGKGVPLPLALSSHPTLSLEMPHRPNWQIKWILQVTFFYPFDKKNVTLIPHNHANTNPQCPRKSPYP